MRPIFVIVSESSGDITGKLIDRVTRLTVVDAEGIDNDTLDVDLDDRGQFIALPDVGERLWVYLGYLGGPIVEMGRYVVDELSVFGPPLSIAITAKGADMTQALKAPKNQSRHEDGLTLGQVAREIAAAHNLTPRIHPQADPLPLEHVDQISESDMAVLARLAEEHDLSLRLTATELILRPHPARLPPVDPYRPPPVTLTARDITRYRWRRQSRAEYAEVRATYYDADRGERVGVTDTRGQNEGPTLELRHDARDPQRAQELAAARKRQTDRASRSLTMDMPGNPHIQAGAHLTLLGLSEPVGGAWTIERVTHTLDRSGYALTIDAVPPTPD